MKRLISSMICIVFVALTLGLTACNRSDEWVASESDGFQLAMTGGGRGRQTNQAPPAPASAPDAVMSSHSYIADVAVDNFAVYGGADRVGWEDIADQGERHVIRTAELEMETEDFDDAVTGLRQLAPAAGGYIESEMLTARGRRMLSIVLRVPSGNFEAVLRQAEDVATVRVLQEWAQDVTDSFYDMIGNLELRQVEEERLLALIEEADSINELLALEQRLSNTRLSIEMYQSQLNNIAGQVAYSTISITLFDMAIEERIIVSPTLGERIGGAFGDSVDGTVRGFQSFIVFLAGVIIPLSIFALIGFGAYKATRLVQRRRAG